MEAPSAYRPKVEATRLLALGVVFLLLSHGEVAVAQIYQWTDAAGRLHFSQDLSQVPAAQRARAEAAAKKPRVRDPLQIYGGTERRAPAPAMRARGAMRPGRAMRIPFERHGTLMKVDVLLNGRVRAPFFIDTGASGISIPWAVAQQLALKVGPDTPHIQVRTANGVISEPLVPLASVKLGPARVDNVTAAVSTTMDIGLLGGTFFNNFVYQVDAAAGVITLVPNAGVRGGHGRQVWLARFEEIRAPLQKVEAYIEKGGFLDESRVRQLESHRDNLRGELEELETEANRKGVPRSWRQ